jgi:hypothetical protein
MERYVCLTPNFGHWLALLAGLSSARKRHSASFARVYCGRASARAGIPTVVIGPGSIDQAHKADACSAFLGRLTAHSCA